MVVWDVMNLRNFSNEEAAETLEKEKLWAIVPFFLF